MSPYLVTLLGLALFLTPTIMIIMRAGLDDGDVWSFIAKQPLKFILCIRLMMHAGATFVAFGTLLAIMRVK